MKTLAIIGSVLVLGVCFKIISPGQAENTYTSVWVPEFTSALYAFIFVLIVSAFAKFIKST
jgi:hypothetical protein